jgi:centromere/kinetochore protein ZW10
MAFKGGSLVSNIIQKASTLDERVLEDKIQNLSKKSSQLKGEIYDLVKRQYAEFDSYVNSTLSLEQRVHEVTSEYRRLTTRIEQELSVRIAQSSDKRQEIESKLVETRSHVEFVQGLVSVYQGLEKSRSDLQAEKFVSSAQLLNRASESLARIGKSGCEAKVYRSLKSELAQVTSELNLRLQEEWRKFLQWSPRVLPENPSIDVLQSVELRVVHSSVQSASQLDEVIVAMRSLVASRVWEQKVDAFGRKLLKVIIGPLIVNSRELKASGAPEKGSTVVKLVKVNGTPSVEESISRMFNSLVLVFTVVQQVVPETHRKTWMPGIGGVVQEEMAELIIAHCLSNSIPKTFDELQNYSEVEAKVKEFESKIVAFGLVDEESFHRLSDYTKNVNVHFAAQIGQDLLEKARNILMKPIHNTVLSSADVDPLKKLATLSIGDSSSSGDTPAIEGPKLTSTGKEDELSQLTFRFPSCAISQSVQEYIQLLYNTLNECSEASSPSMAVQLYCSARSMVDLFCAVLPTYHSSTITELPRVAAIQHNNCMYLAHHLITLGHQFHAHLPSPLNSEVTTFIDQVPIVRQLGEDCFLAEMRKQQDCILECLKLFGSLDNVAQDARSQLVRRGVQQALLHIKKLSKVYVEVLPKEIHHKAVGALMNVLIAEMIRGVLALEDIATDDGKELHLILKLIVERAPSSLSFTNEEEIPTYCSDWERLKGLAMVMDASLQDIVDSWSSGKGSLAQQFTAVELRGLVKAIFRNTERRAAALAKITV